MDAAMNSPPRRRLLHRLVVVACAAPWIRFRDVLASAPLPHLNAMDPMARSLAYTDDASKLDASQDTSYKPGSKCAACMQFRTSEESDGYAPCAIFRGKAVNAKGWCKAFVLRN